MTIQTTILPRSKFSYYRPDEVAECWEGVIDRNAATEAAKMELYHALWDAMDGAKPLSELVNIEDCGPHDVIGLNSVADFWDRFTPAQQARLNELADCN